MLLRKRAEVAEQLLAASLTVSDELKSLRSPFDSIPQDKLGDKFYLYKKRYQRIMDRQEVFAALREAQVRAEAVFDIEEITTAVDKLFEVRQKTLIAIEMLSTERDLAREDDDERAMYRRLRKDMYGSYTQEHDPVGMSQLEAISSLKSVLKPAIQFR